ncbi:peptidase U32 family protein [Pseudobutyrivibrio xylanivorans]|uniref:Putative protease n=1 Tax=Pseudobutyrivibrio xylanivorans DSM 14809 TaxID=1123012 RepID=A0A1M6J7K9_PSEXY|nr:U32 family peptidase [Pseudobutyrivibrio xylanivorans]SHJ42651.1 putative protease [Pseudobutyrivibrio xylanivorans DSM 14809]
MNQLELLSPAGDLQIFKAVVDAGADAVYFGGDLFGARAYAKNFSIEEAAEAIKYAHIRGKKAYLTVNTLLKNPEIEGELYKYLRAYVENGIDAFIVQDFGVFNFIREYFPDTHIHVSTQVSTCTGYGAKLLEDLGAARIVTAREISCQEISKIHQMCPDLEIESFIHGALCVCYSGQCLMSSILGGRSGNRGRCAQPCRLPYDAFDENGKKLNKKGNYILSPKDFCTINYLPEMIEAGVMSFKIEGRMKQLSYATGVVSVYRHYLDEYLYKGARNYSVSQEDIQKLLDYGNRSGFTDLYLHKHNGPDMITFEAPSHTKTETEPAYENSSKIKVNCRVKALLGEEFSVRFYDNNGHEGVASGQLIEKASKKPTTKEDIKKAVSGLGNTPFELVKLDIDADEDIFFPVSVIKNARREAVENLLLDISGNASNPTINEFEKLSFEGNHSQKQDTFVTVSTIEQIKAVGKFDFIKSLAVPANLYVEARKLFDGDLYIYLPPILRDEYTNISIPESAEGVIAASFDELGWLKDQGYPLEKIILDYRLYTFNNRSIQGFRALGLNRDCISYELSLKELKHRDNANSQMIVYSRIPMMITANCTIKNTVGCKKNNDTVTLVDRKNENHIIKCNCDYCYNTIYNSKKYIAFDLKSDLIDLGVKEFRLDFTLEDYKETEEILRIYDNVFNNNQLVHIKEDYTKGHLKRGVE